jgi:hypothetical protein
MDSRGWTAILLLWHHVYPRKFGLCNCSEHPTFIMMLTLGGHPANIAFGKEISRHSSVSSCYMHSLSVSGAQRSATKGDLLYIRDVSLTTRTTARNAPHTVKVELSPHTQRAQIVAVEQEGHGILCCSTVQVHTLGAVIIHTACVCLSSTGHILYIHPRCGSAAR